ncbi:MAG: acetylxylan esterase, partial [Candidatus Hydrogenedentes bacterium]|nr:acetylxylan esterase [Candidatus Hydrogenedentota bacterium]
MIGFLVMTTMLTAVSGELPHSSDSYLWYPREITTGSVTIETGGNYRLWVCVAENANSFVEIADDRYVLEPERAGNRNTDHNWKKLGRIAVESGSLKIGFGSGISMIALSKKNGFNPENALLNMRALPLPDAVEDQRATLARGTNTVFTLPHYTDLESWETTADKLRMRILLGSGLYPMPEKTPLNTQVFDEVAYADYRVAKVHFEASPGFLVTGNLYRPLGAGPFPGVVSPHGHWTAGRLEDSERGSVSARCITLARMGAVAFSYDMIGYVDSRQTKHNWGGNREKLWGIHPFALQLWSAIRAVDFLSALPCVDPDRIGCTGASGGGTQTFALTAVDNRIRVAAPVNMISSTMQGGCLCENAPLLRLDNSNMEVGALAAPRPLLVVSATGDWTRETPRVEYPSIKSIYALYGAADRVKNVHLDYEHNYNQASREAMYRFMGKHLIGGDWESFVEPAYEKPDDDLLHVFPGEMPPEGYLTGEALIDLLIEQAKEKRTVRLPKNTDEATQWREKHTKTFSYLLGVATPPVNTLAATRLAMKETKAYVLEHWVIGRSADGDKIPALFYRNNKAEAQDAVLVVHGRGKAFLADLENHSPGTLVTSLLEKGKAVLVIDAFLIGEHHPPEKECTRTHIDKFHDTFHPTDTGHRVQDILTAFSFLQARYDMTGTVDLLGIEDAGIWAILAGAVESGFRHIAADMNQFDIADDEGWEKKYYVPGIRALGD